MKLTLRRLLNGVGISLIVVACSSMAYGQAKIQIDPDRFVTIGGGMRTAFRTTETAPDSGSYIQKISLDSARLYFNGQLHKDFQVEMNTEYDGSALHILDAVVKYNPVEYFNVWMGRHLPPSDRANLDGPYYLFDYDYPGLVSRYPGIFAGRDNGVSVSGQIQGGRFKYALGAYDGLRTVLGKKDNMLYATRLVVNVLDPEPGYYNSSTYYGTKDVLAVGFAAQHQGDVVNKAGTPEGFTGYNFDLLLERILPDNAVITLEGAFYNYDYQDTPGDGSAFLLQGGYLFPKVFGIGKFQPVIRYQDFRSLSEFDAGVNYVISGHNARLSFIYAQSDNGAATASKTNRFTVGTQFQF